MILCMIINETSTDIQVWFDGLYIRIVSLDLHVLCRLKTRKTKGKQNHLAIDLNRNRIRDRIAHKIPPTISTLLLLLLGSKDGCFVCIFFLVQIFGKEISRICISRFNKKKAKRVNGFRQNRVLWFGDIWQHVSFYLVQVIWFPLILGKKKNDPHKREGLGKIVFEYFTRIGLVLGNFRLLVLLD